MTASATVSPTWTTCPVVGAVETGGLTILEPASSSAVMLWPMTWGRSPLAQVAGLIDEWR